MDGETLQQKTTYKGRENSTLQRQEGSVECVWYISEQIQGTTGHHGTKAKGCQRHCVTCVVLHNMLRTHQGRADRAYDIVALQNEQLQEYFEDQTSVRPTERLLQSSGCIGWAGGQDPRWELPWRQKKHLVSKYQFPNKSPTKFHDIVA